MKKICTLAFLLGDGEICLALKKRGFGKDYWNGFGGKLEKGETISAGIVREIKEESEVIVREVDLKKVAINEFFFKDEKHLEVHVFFIHKWSGEPKETEEMKPEWFPLSEIPYEHMWADDPHWLPHVLKGEKRIGKVWFNEDGKTIENMEWESIKHFK